MLEREDGGHADWSAIYNCKLPAAVMAIIVQEVA